MTAPSSIRALPSLKELQSLQIVISRKFKQPYIQPLDFLQIIDAVLVRLSYDTDVVKLVVCVFIYIIFFLTFKHTHTACAIGG